VKFFTLFLV